MPEITQTKNYDELAAAICENRDEVLFVLDVNFKYKYLSDKFADILGFREANKILNLDLEYLIGAKNFKILKNKFYSVIKTKKPLMAKIEFEEKCFSKTVYFRMLPVVQNDVVTEVVVISIDMKKEEKVKQSLIKKIEQLNSMINNIPMLAYMKDENLKYITGSKYSKNFVEAGLDGYASNIQIDLPEASRIVDMEDNYVLHNRETLIREKSAKSVNGTEHWYKIYKTPVFDDDKNVSGIVSVAQNIDAEKQLTNQKELFVATLSHDLKNPLQAQLTNLKLLSKGTFGNVNDSQKQILDMIIESADFMHKMLRSVLSVYRYDSGTIRLEKSLFKVNDLLQTCIKEASYLASEKNIVFKFNANDENIELYADKGQIRRVITNLVNNAIAYSIVGTAISISLSKLDENVCISIKNISKPIPDEMKKKLFSKYMTDFGAKTGGTGLGLYYSKKVIEGHNGKITLVSEKNVNNFIIELPVVAEVEACDKDCLKF